MSQIQINISSSIQEILKIILKNKKEMSFIKVEFDKRVVFLRELIKLKKTFRLSATILLKIIRVMLKKECNQINQSSKINVIFSKIIRKLKLIYRSLADIE